MCAKCSVRSYRANTSITLFTVGNKCEDDERRAVTREDGRRYAESMGLQFFETSAKENINVDEVGNDKR